MKISKHFQYFKKLRPIIFCNKRIIVCLAIIKLLEMLVAFFPPIIYQFYINRVITDGRLLMFGYVLLGYLVLITIQSLLFMLSRYLETKYKNCIKLDLKQRLLEIYSSMCYSKYEQIDIGELRLCVESDTNVICSFYLTHCLNFLFALVYSVTVIVVLFSMNWYLCLFGCVMIILSYFITKVLGKRIKTNADKYRKEQGKLESMMHDILQNWKEIKLYNLEEKEVFLLSEKWRGLSKYIIKRTRYGFFHGALVAFNLFFVTRMNLYFFGGLIILKKLMTVPTMLVFMNFYEQLYSNVQVVLNSTMSLNSESPQIDRIISMLKEESFHNFNRESADDNSLYGDIRIEDVVFRYQNATQDAIKHISATITEHHSLAIVGESGSGKTTLVKLLVGLYRPSEGKILINQTELHRIPDETKCRYINIVMQDPQIFNMSIIENLLLSNADASSEEIDMACKMANIYDFIQELPEKYNTIIGEKGVKLSGGQKQRLAIARTLLLNPQVLILDEATSSLDSENESAIVKAIQALSKTKTVITISHRFSTISKSDDIIIIQDGEIAEQGRLDTLMCQSKSLSSIFRNTKLSDYQTKDKIIE